MNIETESYTLDYQEDNNTVTIIGSLRLNGMDEYAPILDALSTAVNTGETMVLNLKNLDFLNSSGIAMLAKFTIQVRSKKTLSLTIIGSSTIPWQSKSLKNLQRLLPTLTLNFE